LLILTWGSSIPGIAGKAKPDPSGERSLLIQCVSLPFPYLRYYNNTTPVPQQPPQKELKLDLFGIESDEAIRRLDTALTDAFTLANGWTTLVVRCPTAKRNKTKINAIKLLKECVP
jgi:hypothetical protein